jgi:hypothetical protein
MDFAINISRLTALAHFSARLFTNANATISRSYWNDNLLRSETSTYADNVARTVAYTYDADANRATVQYPFNAYSFTYGYTGRNQLKSVADDASGVTANYWYDVNGNLSQRNPGNSTTSSYSYDPLNRVTNITHTLVGDIRMFDYDYDSVGNRKWTKRDSGTGDVFGYDANDQVTAVKLDIAQSRHDGSGFTDDQLRCQWQPDIVCCVRDHRQLPDQRVEPVHQP